MLGLRLEDGLAERLPGLIVLGHKDEDLGRGLVLEHLVEGLAEAGLLGQLDDLGGQGLGDEGLDLEVGGREAGGRRREG